MAPITDTLLKKDKLWLAVGKQNKEKKFSKQLASEVIIVQLFFKILAITPTKDSHKEFDNQNIKTLKMLHTIGLVPKRRRIQFPGATTWRLCAKAPLLLLLLLFTFNFIIHYFLNLYYFFEVFT